LAGVHLGNRAHNEEKHHGGDDDEGNDGIDEIT